MRRRREQAKRRKMVSSPSIVEPLSRKLSTKLTEGLPVLSIEDVDVDEYAISNVNLKLDTNTNEPSAESSSSSKVLVGKHSIIDDEETQTKRIKSELQNIKIRSEAKYALHFYFIFNLYCV